MEELLCCIGKGFELVGVEGIDAEGSEEEEGEPSSGGGKEVVGEVDKLSEAMMVIGSEAKGTGITNISFII